MTELKNTDKGKSILKDVDVNLVGSIGEDTKVHFINEMDLHLRLFKETPEFFEFTRDRQALKFKQVGNIPDCYLNFMTENQEFDVQKFFR